MNSTSLEFAVALSTLVGWFWALFFLYFPKVKEKFAVLGGNKKRQVVGFSIITSGIVVYVLSCYNILYPELSQLTCDQDGLVKVIISIGIALGSNQTLYQIWPKEKSQ